MRLAIVTCLALVLSACAPTEGVRCNPLLLEDECASGLACTAPVGCVEAVCCPLAMGDGDDPRCGACSTEDMSSASMPD